MTVETTRHRVYVVERPKEKLRYGQGLIAGLDVVIKHFTSAFTKKIDNHSQISGVFTVQYPEEKRPLPEAFRNFPILLYDDETGHELCTSCFQCERICPPQVIHMTQERDPQTGKAVPSVAEFIIEYDACMSCGLCAEVCPFDAIKMDHEFELSTSDHGEMTVRKNGLNRPVSYYEKIAPTFWAEAKDSAYKKLQGSMKRRSGGIGIAPHLVDKIKQARAELEAQTAAAAAEAPAKPATSDDKAARLAAIRAKNTAQQQGESPATATDADANTPEDKAARLAAIRAKNAAKKQGDEPATASAAPEASAEASPQDEKAARLAAIRAKNAAKKQGDEPAAASAATSEASAEASPQDEKAARLAAIRAKNAAKKQAETTSAEPETAATDTNTEATSTPTADAEASPQDEKAARLAAIRAKNAAKKRTEQNQDPPATDDDAA